MLPSHGSVATETRLLLMTFIQIVRGMTLGPTVMNKMVVGILDSSRKCRQRIEASSIPTTSFVAERRKMVRLPCSKNFGIFQISE